MSVIRLADPTSDIWSFLGVPPPEHCSRCNKPLADPTVFWHLGGRESLSLHPSCAEDFAMALIYEARRARAIAQGQSLLAGIDHAWRELAGSQPR